MPRYKTKAKPIVAGDFTDALRAGPGWGDTRVVIVPGERERVALNTRRRQSRAVRWRVDGWVTEREAAAILRFEMLQDACGYGSVRSCCDNSVRGGDRDSVPTAVLRARHDRARAANAVAAAETGTVCLMAVVEMLADEGDPDEARARLFGGTRDYQVEAARGAVKLVGMELADWFGA